MSKLGHLQAEVHTSEFDLYLYERGHIVMPPPRFIAALAGAECAGEISHASALKVVDYWRERFYEAVAKCRLRLTCGGLFETLPSNASRHRRSNQ